MFTPTGRAHRTREHVRRRFDHQQMALVPHKALRACAGKIRHPSKKIAAAYARKLQIDNPRKVNTYACTLCGGWHIGHGY